MLAGRRPLVQAISFSALSMTLFTLVLTFPFMVETLLEQTELWESLHEAAFLAGGYAICSVLISILRAFLNVPLH